MEEKRTGLFENGLIWFGAGVSIAEILTGTYLAPLGMGKGLAAIIVRKPKAEKAAEPAEKPARRFAW